MENKQKLYEMFSKHVMSVTDIMRLEIAGKEVAEEDIEAMKQQFNEILDAIS